MSATSKPTGEPGEHSFGEHSFVVVASRLPVDRVEGPDGEEDWRTSPGGLVTALEPVMREAGGVWIGWSGDAGPAPGPFQADGLDLAGIGLSEAEVSHYYEGFCNATLWPLYHDVIARPQFHRRWWEAYVTVNRRFAAAVAVCGSHGIGSPNRSSAAPPRRLGHQTPYILDAARPVSLLRGGHWLG